MDRRQLRSTVARRTRVRRLQGPVRLELVFKLSWKQEWVSECYETRI